MSKLEMIKKLEDMVAFQVQCLRENNWEDYDRTVSVIHKLEKDILKCNCEN